MGSSDIRVGVIEADEAARDHLPALKAVDGLSLEWICNREVEKARRASSLFRVPRSFSDLHRCTDVDAVLLAVPVGFRREVFEHCARRRWSVLAEAPFAGSGEEHRHYLDLFRGHQRLAAVGSVRRYYRSTDILRSIVASGVFGGVREVWAAEGSRFRGSGLERDSYQTDPRAAGGGILMEQGYLLLDQVFYMLGATGFHIVQKDLRVVHPLDYEVRVGSTVNSALAGEVKFGVSLSRVRTLSNSIEVHLDRVVLRCGTGPGARVSVYDRENRFLFDVDTRSDFGGQLHQPFLSEWADLRDAIRRGTRPRNSAEECLLVASFIDACYEGVLSRE